MQQLATDVNGGNKYEYKYFQVMNPINMNGINFTSIGTTSSKSFHGNFDGGGYTISNFTSEHGLFGYVEGSGDSYGVIRNVKLDNVTVSGEDDVGALVGVHFKGIVENCTVTNAKVTATANYSYAGGLIGRDNGYSTILNSSFSGEVTGNRWVGGLIGKISYSKIENCAVTATVTGNADEVGAIIGANSSDKGSNNNYFYSNLSKAVGTGVGVGSLQFCALSVPSGVTFTAEFENNGLYGGTITLNVGKDAAILNATNLANTAADSNGQVSFTITSNVTVTAANIFYGVTAPACVTVSGTSGTNFSGKTYYAKGAKLNFSVKDGYKIDKTSATVNGAVEVNASLDGDGKIYVFQSGGSYTLATADNVVGANYPTLTRVYKITAPENVNIGGAIQIGENFYAEQNTKLTVSAADGYLVENISGVTLDANNSFTVGTSNVNISADLTVGGFLNGGLKWELIDGKLTVSGNGSMPDYVNDNYAPWYNWRNEITSVEIGDGVTSIGILNFYNCANLQSVTIPASVTQIESSAFLNCANLQAVNLTVPSGKTLIVEGEILSNGGDTVNLKSAIDANNYVEIACVTIGTDGKDFGDGLKWIFSGGTLIISGNGNMPDFDSLTEQPWADELVKKVIIGEGVTAIGTSAFENRHSLSSVTIPAGVTSIGSSAFCNCTSLTTVTIPAGVTSIGGSAFYNCTSLTTITLPASVTFIGGSAFKNCNENLSVKVAVPAGKAVFINGTAYNADETGFADITAAAKKYMQFNLTYGEAVPESKIEWEIADGVLTISGTGAMTDYNTNNLAPWYNRCSEITSVVIGEGVTSIGDYAFYDLSNLQSVTIPAGVTSIGYRAFAYCGNLQSVTIPASVTSIGYWAFFDCKNLESAVVTVPEGQHLVIGDEIRSDGGAVNVAEYVKKGVSVNFSASPVEEVTYTEEKGASKTVLAFALDDSTAELGGGTYVVKGNVTFDDGLTFKGGTKIILGEGATLTVNGDNGISIAGDLSIYGTGTLNATGGVYTQNNDIIIASGTVTTAELKGYDIGIFGGKVTASKVEADNSILLDWTNTDDFISAGSYSSAYGGFFIGKNFYSGDTVYGGTEPAPAYISETLGRQFYTLTAEQITALNGVKLNAFDYYTFSAPEGVDFTVSGETKTLGGVTYCKSGATVSVTAPEGKYLRGSDGKFFTGSKTFTVAGNIALTEPPTIGNLKLTVDADGNGTYELNTAAQLVALSAYVNAGNDCKGMTFKLTTDIDMSGIDFAPIGQHDGQSALPFRGTFDGGGNVIRNLTINSEQMTVGLFGYSQGLVQGVVLDNFNITGSLAVAGIVAYNSGVVMNCATLGGTISGGNFAGTVVGMNVGIITDSYSYGELAAIGKYNIGESTVARIYLLDMPEGVTAQGALKFGGKYYAAADTTITLTADGELNNITVNGKAISGNTFTVDGNADITADVIAAVDEPDKFNNNDPFKATAVVVGGTTGDFSTYSALYSITASQENSTLTANAKNNTIILEGGGTNILTGGKGNDTFKFTAGGGIVTDYGIGATKGGNGKALATASGTDIVKVDGEVKGIYFDRGTSTKKTAIFTATIVYSDDNDDDQVIVLKDIAKKPTTTNSNPAKAVYQTNDVAAATLKIWDTSNTKQAVLSATNLKKLFHDDNDDAFTGIIKEKTDYLVNISDDITPEINPFEVTSSGGDHTEGSGKD